MFGKIDMAIMGTGNIASTMAKTIKHVSEVSMYAVASRNQDRATQFAKDYGFKKAYGSYEEMLNDKKVNLVYIATPISEHYENMIDCIEHGKNVLCEKSFTLNEEQAKKVFALAADKNVLVTEAIWVRYMPMLAQIQEVLASNVIGEPAMLTANLAYNIKQIKRMTDPKLGGGSLLDVGVYPINFASMMFGDDIVNIDACCTYTSTGVDESDSITFRYRDGKMAVLTCSMDGISDRQGIIYGSKGYMIIENINNFETLSVFNSANEKTAQYKRPRQKTGYEYEVIDAVKAIKSGWLECPAMPHVKTLTIMHEMDEIRKILNVKFPQEEEPKITEPILNVAPEKIEAPAETPVEAEPEIVESHVEEATTAVVETPAETPAETTEENEEPAENN
ncbi:MAG: Gfo/Idh/MocA family oxidoreductase [Lachnospiraceae bacterium]|jgi:predicted dehydrogenase